MEVSVTSPVITLAESVGYGRSVVACCFSRVITSRFPEITRDFAITGGKFSIWLIFISRTRSCDNRVISGDRWIFACKIYFLLILRNIYPLHIKEFQNVYFFYCRLMKFYWNIFWCYISSICMSVTDSLYNVCFTYRRTMYVLLIAEVS